MKDGRILVVLLVLIFVLSGCSNSTSTPHTNTKESDMDRSDIMDSLIVDNKESNLSESDEETLVNEEHLTTYADEHHYISLDNLYTLGETVNYEDAEYIVTSITITKDIGEVAKEDINYFSDEEIDEKGNLINNYSYIFVDLTVKNVSGVQKEVLLNNTFARIEGKEAFEAGGEARYMNPRQEKTRMADYFKYILDKKEKIQVTVLYIMPDESIIEDMYYVIGSSGSFLDNIDNKFIKVE